MEKKTKILDASVIIKWFTKEEKKEKALVLREKYANGEIEILVPDLILYEISNALRFNPSFYEEDVNNAIQTLFDMEISIVTPTKEILRKAVNL